MYNELYHHGILGQKWGKKNGPPYPLSAEDHAKVVQDAITKGSATEIKQYTKELTNKELIDALNRIKWMQEIDKISAKEHKTAADVLYNFMDKVGDVKNWAQTALTLYLTVDKALSIIEKKKQLQGS